MTNPEKQPTPPEVVSVSIVVVMVYEDEEDYGETTSADQVSEERRKKLYLRDYSKVRVFIEGELAAEFDDHQSDGASRAEGFVDGFTYLFRQLAPASHVDIKRKYALWLDPVATSLTYPEKRHDPR